MTTKAQLSEAERQSLDSLIARAQAAQHQIVDCDDMTLDVVMHDVLNEIEARTAYWAEEEYQQSGMGNATDKNHKLHFVISKMRQVLTGLKTGGLVGRYDDMPEYADPLGVIFAISPLTGPIPNALYKAMLSLKTRNAIIISAPRGTAALGQALVDTLRGVLERHGLPADLIASCPPDSRAITHYMMQNDGIALNLVTGGSRLVKAAYASGRPTQGVGAGNVPVLVDATVDADRVAADILLSKRYDNGILCGSESNIVVERRHYDALAAKLEARGAWLLKGTALADALDTLFEPGTHDLQKHLLGQDGPTLAHALGHPAPDSVTLVVLALDGTEPWAERCSYEKLACVVSLRPCSPDEGVSICHELILKGGAGHTAVVHTRLQATVDAFAQAIPAGRILVNTPSTQGMIGATTRYPLSLMLGCGTYGGNSTTDPIQWRHLVNLKRVAYGCDLR